MNPSYLNLCIEFYDLTKPEVDPKETAPRFYEKQKEVNQFLGNIIHFLRGHERKWNK